MPSKFDPEYADDGRLVDLLDGTLLEPRPEEIVRQRYLRVLHHEYGYAKNRMAREVKIVYGSDFLTDARGSPVRADIVIYHSARGARERDQGNILLVVECKAPNRSDGYNQLVSYLYMTSAEGGVWFNDAGDDDGIEYYRRLVRPTNELRPWLGIPRSGEAWDALGRRRKVDLRRPSDIRGLLRRCHNRLHGRGAGGDEADLTMDMVKLILAKAMDEERPGDLPEFYCTEDEYATPARHRDVASRVEMLFTEVKRQNADVFSEADVIGVGDRAIVDVVSELQQYQLVSPLDAAVEWDIMGHAYEQYTSVHLRREAGQFFTNRLAIDMMVAMADPGYADIILDPAGGSGGFLTGAVRYVRAKILSSDASPTSKSRQLDRHRTNLFLVELKKRLVRVAKTAMILHGDGHAGMTVGDSLGPYDGFETPIISHAGRGRPDMIFTNPPFAGVGEGRVSDPATLARFQTGHKWDYSVDPPRKLTNLVSDGVPPELLFLERCIDWLSPGGKLAIVLPKSFLDTVTYRSGRELLFRETHLLAVLNCHKDTFQPHTGVRTCIVICQKRKDGLETQQGIFMGVLRRPGQDSEGVPKFKYDAQNRLTSELDEDFSEVGSSFQDFRLGEFEGNQRVFVVSQDKIGLEKKINPQAFLPDLNHTLRAIEAIDGVDGWSVESLDELAEGIRVFKGPRLKSENLIVDEAGPGVEQYHTPSSMLQTKSESAKYLNVARANAKQLSTINAIRVQRGDILITRSGTVGRVTIVSERHDGAIVSDDLIRVRCPDVNVRDFLYAYLNSKFAQDQMMLNEYGAVQQHLEPVHIKMIQVPVPDDRRRLGRVLREARGAVRAREAADRRRRRAEAATVALIAEAMIPGQANDESEG